MVIFRVKVQNHLGKVAAVRSDSTDRLVHFWGVEKTIEIRRASNKSKNGLNLHRPQAGFGKLWFLQFN